MGNNTKGYNSCQVYSHGVYLSSNLKGASVPFHGGKRGNIIGFSSASARRMREWFLTKDIKGSHKVGMCLTLPFPDEYIINHTQEVLEWFKCNLNRVWFSWKYRHPDSGLVYRVELQKRQAPHIHLVMYARDDKAANDLSEIWFKTTLKYQLCEFNCSGFAKYGIRIDEIKQDAIGYYRYMVDHATKHKQEQLGYIGKQWGVVNRSLFDDVPGVGLYFDDDLHMYEFFRLLRKINRYPITKNGKIVKYRQSKRGFGVSFLRGDNLGSKIFQAARTQANTKRINSNIEYDDLLS